jgi:hypothetical protein
MTAPVMLRVPALDCSELAGPLCVAIAGSAISGSTAARHTAVVVLPVDGPHRMIHLGRHNELNNDLFDAPYCWVEVVGLDPVVRDTFVDWMLSIWQHNEVGGIPYGFDLFVEDHFDADGKYVGVSSGTGLTCATFALSCFAGYGVILIEHTSWPLRPADAIWQQRIAVALERRAGAAHAAALQNLVGKIARFRPEEVAASASAYSGKPMAFAEADEIAQGLLQQMRDVQLI